MNFKKLISLAVLCLLPLLSPRAGAQTDTLSTREPDYIIHTVRWFENLKDISKKYDVPIDVLMEVNGLEKPKVKSRQKIKVPADLEQYYRYRGLSVTQEGGEETTSQNGQEQGNEEEGGTPEPEDSGESHGGFLGWNWNSIFGFRDKVSAVMILPLGALDGSNDNYLDFYSGALLAARDLGEKGLNADISVIDLTTEGLTSDALSRIMKADMVIGPIDAASLKRLTAAQDDVPVISPLDPRAASLADSTANFIQAPSSSNSQYEDIANWIETEYSTSDNIILVSETGVELSSGMNALVNALGAKNIAFQDFSYSILQGRNIIHQFESKVKADVKNRIVILSEREAFVNDVIRNVNLLIYNKFDIVVYSSSKIRSFETIDVETLHAVNLHVCSSYYINYDDPRVKRFVLSYRALFNTEPSQFAFQGYDVTGFFLKACHDLGGSWMKKLQRIGNARMLQTDFNLVKAAEDGGLVNTGIRRIIYGSDYSVKEQQR